MRKLLVVAFLFAAGLGCVSSAHAQGMKTIFNNSKVAINVTLTPSSGPVLKARIAPFASNTFSFDSIGIITLAVTETTATDSVTTTFRALESSKTLPNVDHTFNDNVTLVVTFNPTSFSFALTADQ